MNSWGKCKTHTYISGIECVHIQLQIHISEISSYIHKNIYNDDRREQKNKMKEKKKKQKKRDVTKRENEKKLN